MATKKITDDSFHADVIIQSALFDCVIYRSQVRRRPQVA